MLNLSPKNDKFFDLFICFADIISESSLALQSFVENPKDLQANFDVLKAVEHKGDELLHNIFEELNNSFITPLDREDIYLIGRSLDDVVDYTEGVAKRYLMYDLTEYNESVITLTKFIVKASEEIKGLMVALKNMKKFDKLKERIVEINKIENEGDLIFIKAMRELFTSDKKEIQIIMWKDIYEKLEKAIDSCEGLANIIEGVVMKHV